MIDIKKLTVGQVVYQIKPAKYGIFRGSKWDQWPIKIKEIDLEKGTVLASWNGNADQTYYARKGKFNWYKDQK